jgi:4-hydroxy-tetrahydrodipicolinate synthase
MTTSKPWHGVLTATALPFRADLSIDFDKYADHIKWQAENGVHGAIPNGSLGEYQVLTPVPGVAAYGAAESRRWTEQAAEMGAKCVMLLPPTAYRANDEEIIAHYKEVSKVGLPIIAYNNPFDTKVDLTPQLVGRIAEAAENVVAIKEFSGDVRRVWQLHHYAPRIEVLVGADDVLLELSTGGVVGWIAGFPNALPKESVELYNLCLAGKYAEAKPIYAAVHNLFNWDSRKEFIVAIKVAMEAVGRYGGPTRLPRLPLPANDLAQLNKDIKQVLDFYKNRK